MIRQASLLAYPIVTCLCRCYVVWLLYLLYLTGLIKNDTIVGDPLLTVPIHGNFSEVGVSDLSLCYEIHGSADAYFNFVSDECTSVNAHYVQAQAASFLNVIDQMSVLAVSSSGQCRRIEVDVETCSPKINNMQLPLVGGRRMPYESDGISVRVYPRRVRIAVPNCADTKLVMWVICQNQTMEDPFNFGRTLGPIPMIKYVVARGFNLQEFSHGLLGGSRSVWQCFTITSKEQCIVICYYITIPLKILDNAFSISDR